MASSNAHLAVYLNDHLAGAAAALEILDLLQKHEDAGLRRFAQEIRSPILEDRDALVLLMRDANIATSSARRAAGWIAAQAAELKVKADDPADTGLRTFELLEILALGIDGKRALWAVLWSIAETMPSVSGPDYTHLTARAHLQRGMVEAQRLAWASTAFAVGRETSAASSTSAPQS